MKPTVEETDIIIRRASNGWIAFTGSGHEEGCFTTTVHEERETEWGGHEALIDLFHEHFPEFTQSKKNGGIKLEVREKGYDFEEDDGGNTPERIDEQIEWLEEKIARQKEVDKMVGQVTFAATKAARKVAEQHKEAFERLAENGEEND